MFEEDFCVDEVILSIKADEQNYYFGFGKNLESIKYVAQGRTQFLSAEASEGVFTGVFFGLFVESDNKSCKAKFSKYHYREY